MNTINTSMLSITDENERPTLGIKLKGLKEREERTHLDDFGTSVAGDAAEGYPLPGKEWSPRVFRKRSVVPSKPSPPPSVKTDSPRERRYSVVQPYCPTDRSNVVVMSTPPMVRSDRATVPVPTLPPSAPNSASDEADGASETATTKAPVPPPRRKRSAPKSPSSARGVRVLPDVPEARQRATKSVQQPPAVPPKRKSLSPETVRRRISGVGCEGCNGDESTTAPVDGVSGNHCHTDVHSVTGEHDQRKETVPGNISESALGCSESMRESESDTHKQSNIVNNTKTADNPATESSRDTRPPLPPRVRKRVKITNSPSPSSSPKFPRSRTLPHVPSPSQNSGRDEPSLRKEVSLVHTEAEPRKDDKNQVVSSSDEVGVGFPTAGEGEEGEVSVRRLTTRLEQKPQLFPNGVPVPTSTRRNTIAASLPKPPLPPKSAVLQLRSKQPKPPIPRPRSGSAAKKREKEEETSTDDNSLPVHRSPKQSPVLQRLGLGAKNLANSTPSLATSADDKSTTLPPPASHNGPPATDGNSPNRSSPRKASSGSPVHVLAQQLEDANQMFCRGERTKSIPQISSLPTSPAKAVRVGAPPKPPTKRRLSKCSSLSDILDENDDVIGRRGSTEGAGLAKQVMKELKKSMAVQQKTTDKSERARKKRSKKEEEEEEVRGERQEPEGAESHPTTSESNPPSTANERRKSSKQQQRSVSIGDISHLVGGGEINSARPHTPQIMVGFPGSGLSDASSYTSSEGRASVMSSDTQSLLERARQISKNKKWCDQTEVKESSIVPNLAKEQLLQQEAIFEIITSEATYHLNLATLIDNFMDDPKMDPSVPESDRILDRTQHSMIFSNVREIRRVSARFLEEILTLFTEDIFLRKIFSILEEYARDRFVCYERYCASQGHRLKELKECTEKSENFQRELKRLEEEANQTLQSLVTAPMQRVTKLPLIMGEILKRTPHDDPSRGQIELTCKATEEVADLCNKGAGKIGDLIHLETIWKKLHFGQLKPFLILAPGRRLKKEGTIDRLKVNKRRARVMPEKVHHYLFVFTDLLMMTTEDKERHHVVDYCPLNSLTIEPIPTNHQPSTLDTSSSSSSEDSYTMSGAEWTVAVAGEEHAFLLTLQKNAAKNDGTYIFVFKSEAEKNRWMELLREKSTEVIAGGPPKTLTGRNLTLLTRKRKRDTPAKKYWWKQPQVEQSGIVKTLSQKELELQEAIFEVVTSEEEHFTAMETLTKHYMSDTCLNPSLPEEQRVLSGEEFNDIFRYVKDVYHISESLLKTLHVRQSECILVDSICDIFLLCIERRFQGYVRYCTNLPNSLEQFDSSIEKNESFRGYLKQLEEDQCPLRSLLMAPMDRVTRLPELFRNIRKKTPSDDLNHCLVETTLTALEKVEKLCMRGQEKVAKIKELFSLERQLDFGSVKPFSLVSVGRSLLRRGSLTQLKIHQWFGKAVRKKAYHLIILTDYLIITKKVESMYKVLDTSFLSRVKVEPVEPHAIDHTPSSSSSSSSSSSLAGGEDPLVGARWAVSKAGENHAFLVTLLDTRKSYTFVASSEVERVDWMEGLTVQKDLMSFDDENDTVLAWEYFYMEAAMSDCCHDSEARAAEDLDMKKGEILRVYRATKGWCEGLRIHDLQWGRFPAQYLSHVPPGWREGRGEGEGVRRGSGEFLVEVIHDFPGEESGELPLEKGDIVKIARQMGGWCEGKKLRGNQWGWFPSTHTKTIGTRPHSSPSPSPSLHIPSHPPSFTPPSFTPPSFTLSPSPSPSPSK